MLPQYGRDQHMPTNWIQSPIVHAEQITGCLKPTNIEELYLLSGIAPPSIRRDVCDRVEKAKQENNEAQSLHGQIPVERLEIYKLLPTLCETCKLPPPPPIKS